MIDQENFSEHRMETLLNVVVNLIRPDPTVIISVARRINFASTIILLISAVVVEIFMSQLFLIR